MKFIHSLLLLTALPVFAQAFAQASAPLPPMPQSPPPAPRAPGEARDGRVSPAVPAPAPAASESAYKTARIRIFLAEQRRDPALLTGLTSHADPLIRARAARAAGRIGAPSATAALSVALGDTDASVRQAGAWGAIYFIAGGGKADETLRIFLRSTLKRDGPERQPALEALIDAADTASADEILRLSESAQPLKQALAGHLFRLDTPAVREKLKLWAADATDPATQYGALYSMIRLKIEDENFYRGILEKTTGETAVVALKGLGMTKSWSPETKAAVESATERKSEMAVVIEAYGTLAKHDYEASAAISRLLSSDYSPQDSQLMLKIFDDGSQLDCDNFQGFASFSDFIYFHPNLAFSKTKSMGSIDYSIPPERLGMPVQLLRRYFSKAVACTNTKDHKVYFSDYRKLFDNLRKASYPTFRLYQAIADGFSDNPDEHTVELTELAHSDDARVRANAISTLVTRGEAVTPFLADPESEVVANVADAAAKWKTFPKEKLSAAALAKAYDHFNAKGAPDGPNTRIYLTRLAAACAVEQPGCLALLKRAIAKDRERAVQIDGWNRWPDKLLASRPAWPKPNLPPPDFKAAEARLATLIAKIPRFEVETTQGKFTMAFTARGESPLNVLNLRDLVAKKFFDGITWHRVVPNFVVQGGDPRGDGSGGPGHLVPCEYNSFPYTAGTVGMALDGKDTGGSQFFVALTRVSHLDYHYTVLGQVEPDGLPTLYKLGEDDKIISIRELE